MLVPVYVCAKRRGPTAEGTVGWSREFIAKFAGKALMAVGLIAANTTSFKCLFRVG